MFKITETYTDYDGNERTEDFYFNLTQAEITEMELSTDGGLETMIKELQSSKDGKRIVAVFKDLILRSYGKKSPNGRSFVKSPEISKDFSETEAYSQIFMRLATDADYAGKFVTGIVPSGDKLPTIDAQAAVPSVVQ